MTCGAKKERSNASKRENWNFSLFSTKTACVYVGADSTTEATLLSVKYHRIYKFDDYISSSHSLRTSKITAFFSCVSHTHTQFYTSKIDTSSLLWARSHERNRNGVGIFRIFPCIELCLRCFSTLFLLQTPRGFMIVFSSLEGCACKGCKPIILIEKILRF